MNPAIQRLKDMATGFEGGTGIVTINLADAAILGVKPKKDGDQTVAISAEDLCAKCDRLNEKSNVPDGSEPTPNQANVSPGPDMKPKK